MTLWNKTTFQFEEGETEQEAWVNSTHKPLVPGRYLSEGRMKYIKDMEPILHKPAVWAADKDSRSPWVKNDERYRERIYTVYMWIGIHSEIKKSRNQKLHTKDMYVVNKSKGDEEITEIERCLQQSHKKGCFSQSCYRTMTVIEVVPRHDKEPQYSMGRHHFLIHHFPWRSLR